MISDFLKPPTDNLYKFMCISGLILLLLSVTYPAWLVNKLVLAAFESKRDYDILKVDIEAVKNRDEELDYQREALIAEHKDLSQQLDNLEKQINESKADPSHAKDKAVVAEFVRVREIRSQIAEKDLKLREAMIAEQEVLRTLEKKTIEAGHKLQVNVWETRTAFVIAILGILGSVIGLFLTWKGFNAWSLRVQVYQDAILKKQAEESAK